PRDHLVRFHADPLDLRRFAVQTADLLQTLVAVALVPPQDISIFICHREQVEQRVRVEIRRQQSLRDLRQLRTGGIAEVRHGWKLPEGFYPGIRTAPVLTEPHKSFHSPFVSAVASSPVRSAQAKSPAVYMAASGRVTP